jgi:hypothetical protein
MISSTDKQINSDTQQENLILGACQPAPLTNWQPTFVPPRRMPGACSATQISDYYNECLSNGSPSPACNTFKSNNATCAACLASTKVSDPAWGWLVESPKGRGIGDVPACIAVADPLQLDCAKKYEALYECDWAACDSCDRDAYRPYNICVANAERGECAKYSAEAYTCAQALVSSRSNAAQCIPTAASTVEGFFTTVAGVLCE